VDVKSIRRMERNKGNEMKLKIGEHYIWSGFAGGWIEKIVTLTQMNIPKDSPYITCQVYRHPELTFGTLKECLRRKPNAKEFLIVSEDTGIIT